MVFNLSQKQSIANRYISELRDKEIQLDRMRFRRNLERMGQIFAYEISKTLKYDEEEVQTPLGIANASISSQRIVVGSILRAAIPMHNGVLSILDQADNAFISAYRKHHKDGTFEINLEYITCPDLDDAVLILVDPMLATGSSMDKTIVSLQEYGTPTKIHVATIIASSDGLNHIKRRFPSVQLWVGAVDEELTAKSYIVPGLGDAGDLAYGGKVQS